MKISPFYSLGKKARPWDRLCSQFNRCLRERVMSGVEVVYLLSCLARVQDILFLPHRYSQTLNVVAS